MRYLISDVLVWTGARRLLRQGKDVRIGGRAFDLLLALIERRDRVVSRDELYELVWPDVAIDRNNLAFQVWTLRRLLGAQAVATVARRGYQLAAPVRELPDEGPAAAAPLSTISGAGSPPGSLAAHSPPANGKPAHLSTTAIPSPSNPTCPPALTGSSSAGTCWQPCNACPFSTPTACPPPTV